MADTSVRPARLVDVDAIAQIQWTSWPTTPGLPESAAAAPELSEITRAWERAVVAPPSPRHTVWSALEGERVVGLVALGPATDPDLDATTTSELLTLVVAPTDRRQGHGSRLLAAAMESLQAQGQHVAVAWLNAQDDQTREFLEAAGWGPDGAFRTLAEQDDDPDAAYVRQVRVGTDLSADPADPS